MLVGLTIFFGIISSCTKNVYINTLRPAVIDVPQHIQKVALVNRTIPQSAAGDIFEGIFTGEGIGQDQQAVQEMLSGLQTTMGQSPRFTTVIHTKSYKGGKGLSAKLPDAMSWARINQICRESGADAVLAIESFDSDWVVTDGTRQVKKKNESGQQVEVTEYYAEGIATVKSGLRLYDPKNKGIIDQQSFSEAHTWEGKGSSITDAMNALIQKNRAVLETGRFAGRDYAFRISPQPVRLRRVMYTKAKGNRYLEKGSRLAETGDWEGAIQSWRAAMSSTNDKVLGRAAHNLAVGYEVIGDYEEALKWAQRAYANHNNKQSRTYSRQLRLRMQQEDLVDMQLGN